MFPRLITIVAGVLSSLSAASAVFAYVARLDPALGAPWWQQGWFAVYAPWAVLGWAWQWAYLVPQAFILPGLVGALVGVWAVRQGWAPAEGAKQPQAHWASWAELKTAELIGVEGEGIVLGKIRRGWRWVRLRYRGGWHVLIIAGTGTGKTASIIMPTLLEYRGSVIVHDPKGGLRAKTAGYRATLGKVVCLEPMSDATDQYNLWDAVRLGTDDEMRDVDMITKYLTNPDGVPIYDDTSKHFRDLVQQFFRGVSLYGLHTGLARTGAEFDILVNQTDWHDLLLIMSQSTHPIVRRAAMVASRPGERELGSLQTTMARALDMFVDPRVAHMTSRSSFTLKDLRDAEDACTIYLCVPFTDQRRLQSLVCVLLQIFLDQCTSSLTGWRHRVLAMIEEFPTLGKFEPISDALGYAREYGVQFCLVTPSMEKLVGLYGVHHNFLEACRVQAVFGLSDDAVAKRFSSRAGTRQQAQQRHTTQKGGTKSTTEEMREEPLLNPTGFLDLGDYDIALFAGRYKRILSQARYYEEEPWATRAHLPAPIHKENETCLPSSV